MFLKTHVIDPDADTILVLKNPATVFALWEDSATELATKQQPIGDESLFEHEPISPVEETPLEPEPEPEPESELVLEESAIEEEPVAMEESVATEDTTTPEESAEEAVVVDDPQENEEEGIQYMVSSRHLALASTFFKISLAKEGWVEGIPSKADGKYHLQTSDWDAEAFLILLNIIHLRNSQVKRKVTLDMLAKFATLVDYYDCAEAVELYTDMWIRQITKTSPLPDIYGRDLMLWASIAWVFNLPDVFQKATKIAISQSMTPTVQDMGLPIPKAIIDDMEQKRYRWMEELIEELHVWLNKFRDAKYHCPQSVDQSFVCSSFLFGALTKHLDGMRCLLPRPEVPFSGLSFSGLCDAALTMKTPVWYSDYDDYRRKRLTPHSCGFSDTVQQGLRRIQSDVSGLQLDDFKDASEGQ